MIGIGIAERGAELSHVIGSGRMVLFQGDEDFAVGGGDQGAFAEREVEPAVGDADVVEERLDLAWRNDAANGVLDLCEFVLGLLDARAGHAAHVELDEPGVDAREEVAPELRPERGHRDGDEGAKPGDDDAAMRERPRQPGAVRHAQPLEAALECSKEATDETRRRGARHRAA